MIYSEKVKKNRDFGLYFVNSKTGFEFYAYVLVPANKYGLFEQAVRAGNHNYSEYGTIVDFCIGKSEPPESMKQDVQKFIETIG